MKTNTKLMSVFLIFAMILAFIPSNKVNAASTVKDILIISQTEVTAEQAEEWAESKGASDAFIELAELYFEYSEEHGQVNPAIAYVQAAKETGYGNFGGVIDESYYNPCGLKTITGGDDYDPNAHQRFESWDDGVTAHLDHLALYAGASGYPRSDTEDPRHFVTIKGKATTVNSLGGNWAPSITYGEEINKMYRDLLDYSDLTITEEEEIQETEDPNNDNSGNETEDSEDETEDSTDTEEDETSDIENKSPNFQVNIPTAVKATEPVAKPQNEGTSISSNIGWKKQNGKWYYYKSDGTKAKGWIKPDANWYYLYSDGAMATGWTLLYGTWYYLKPSGAMHIGWIKDGASWYYLEGNGAMSKGMKLINGKKYFMDNSGAMRTSWYKISENWYYFSGNGDMLTGWIRPDGKWYYLNENGIMATNWAKIKDVWYYLGNSGAMTTGWIYYNSNYYYLNSSGALVTTGIVDGWAIKSDGTRGNRESIGGPGGGKVIVVDPGHNYGGDDGAYATHNGVTYVERDLNMQVALKVKKKLEENGYTVIMTRNESDRNSLSASQSLANRVNIANNFNADFFVSIHHNISVSVPTANGVEVYYSSKAQDAVFGGAYSSSKVSISKNMAASISSSISNTAGAYNRGAKDSNFFVCRNTKMPSVLVEVGFLSNATEAAKCANSTYQDKVAIGIVNSIINNF